MSVREVQLVVDSVRSGSFRSRDVEEVQAFYTENMGVRASVAASPDPLTIDFVAHWMRLGPLGILEHTRMPAIVLHSRYSPYGVGFATEGALLMEQDRTRVITSPTRAVVHRPDAGPFLTRACVPSLVYLLAVDRPALEAHLEDLLDRPIRGPIRLAPTLDLTGPGHSWLQLVHMFTDALTDPESMIRNPVVAAPLVHALLSGLLKVSDHPYRGELDHPPARCHPRQVKHALEAIHTHPEQPHTPATLAGLTGVSVRSLQDSFHRYVGASPMNYLRHVRLDRVHEDLRRGQASTVAEAAHRWGFTHLGRFAAAYQRRYGATPSATLRTVRPQE